MPRFSSLTLTRKLGQRVIINGPCTIEVVKVGAQPRLRVTAEVGVNIVRSEICDEEDCDDGDSTDLALK